MHPWASPRAERAIAVAVPLLYAAPLALCRYFPGLDLPWHAAVIAVLAGDDPGRFLGAFEVAPELSSYVTFYYAAAGLARLIGDVAIAVQLLLAAYVIGFIWGARRLITAFGGAGYTAVLAAPAAYSLVLDFGFATYALSYPLTLFLWAAIRELVAGERAAPRVALAALLAAAVALTHPFAAAVAVAGGLLLLLLELRRESAARTGAGALALALGSLPAALAVATIAGDSGGGQGMLEGLSLWERLQHQNFVRVDESVSALPARLFGASPEPWRYLLFWLGLSAALTARHLVGPPPAGGQARRGPWLLLLLLVALYLVTPYSFLWPRYWYAVQFRLLPLAWVVLLVCLRARPGAGGIGPRLPALGIAAAALAVTAATAIGPFCAEARDFRRAIADSAPRARTLGLIEQPRVAERKPASPFRHFAAHVMAERGGAASHLLDGRSTGVLGPVRRVEPLPPAPMPGYPRSFDFEVHGRPWDQILIRHRDPAAPFDYFREHRDEVELVGRAGRWRLYRVRR